MRRTLKLSIAFLLALATLPAGGAPAHAAIETRPAGPCRFTATDMMFTSFDGTQIDATYYVPSSASKRHPEPAVMLSHGFGGWHRGEGDRADQRMLASHCYVVLGWTERGFGNSGGEVHLLSPDYEVRDAQGLVDWLARRPEVLKDRKGDPRVGMFGGSYGGGIQTLLATHDRRIDAITPQVTWNDLRYSLYPNGAIKHGWINLLFASGTASSLCGADYTAPECNAVPPGVTSELVQHYLTSTVLNGDFDGSTQAWLAERSPVTYAENWKVPTLFVQGIGDTLFTLNEAIRSYQIVRHNRAPAKMIFFSGGHGQIDDPGQRRYINDRVLDWFLRHLRKDRRASTGPAVEVYAGWLGAKKAARRFIPFTGWPVSKPIRFELTTIGGAPAPVPVPGLSAVPIVNSVAPTSYSEVPNFQSGGGPNSPIQASDAAEPLTAASFETAALEDDLAMIGSPQVHFTLTSTAGEAIVFWKIYDEAPDGTRVLVHNLVTPIRVVGAGTWPATEPITTPVEILLSFQSIVHHFEPGHRIVLTVSTTDTAHYASRIPAVYGIGAAPGADGLLTLPVAG